MTVIMGPGGRSRIKAMDMPTVKTEMVKRRDPKKNIKIELKKVTAKKPGKTIKAETSIAPSVFMESTILKVVINKSVV